MPTKGIYIEKATFEIVEQYATANGLTISKAINRIVQASTDQQTPKKRDISASKQQKVAKPQQKKESPVKEPKISLAEQRRNQYLADRIKELEKGK